jgi:hypothetical protein
MIKNSANSVLVSLLGMVIPGIGLFTKVQFFLQAFFKKSPLPTEKQEI